MHLDLTSFANAVAQLEEALAYCHSDLAEQDSKLARHLRAAAIQAFEFTYEISYKMLKRFLEATEPNPSAIEEMTFNEVIRLGYAKGLLNAELLQWKEFRKERGTTSHTYDEQKALDVFEDIPSFLVEVKHLMDAIRTRQERLP